MDTRPVSSPASSPLTQVSNSGAAESAKSAAIKRAKESKEGSVTRNSGRKDWDVQISPEAIELAEARQKAMNVAKATNPVREDRVADIKRRIADGSYKVDAGKVADGIMAEAIRDHVASSPDEIWTND